MLLIYFWFKASCAGPIPFNGSSLWSLAAAKARTCELGINHLQRIMKDHKCDEYYVAMTTCAEKK